MPRIHREGHSKEEEQFEEGTTNKEALSYEEFKISVLYF